MKTDKVDAKVLCELLRMNGLPRPVHMPAPEARSLRGLLVARQQLVRATVRIRNTARGMIRQEGTRLPANALQSMVGWTRLLQGAYERDHILPILCAYMESYRTLRQSIGKLEKELNSRAEGDQRVARLKTIPCVGRITAMTTVAALDDANRFTSSRKVVSYSGLAPTVRQSGERAIYGSITREGRAELRHVWVQVAHVVARDTRSKTRTLRSWYRRIEKRRGKKTAIVALARRLLTIAYHILREETEFDPNRLSRKM